MPQKFHPKGIFVDMYCIPWFVPLIGLEKSHGKERSGITRQGSKAKSQKSDKNTKIYEMSVMIFQVILIKNFLQTSKT